MTQQQRPPVKLAITFPGYSRASYIAICRGNERIATLLDQFVYYASARITESCKVVILECSHKDIREKLPIHLSRKTLIDDLDKLDAWGFVASHRYGRSYTVDLEAIQQAVNHPPEPAKRVKTGGRKGCEKEERRHDETCKSCKVSNLKLSELEQEVVTLKLYVSSLKQNVSDLQQYVSNLKLYNPASSGISEGADERSEEAPVLTDLSCPITDLVVLRAASADADTQQAPCSEESAFEDESPTEARLPAIRPDEISSQQTSLPDAQDTPPPECPAASVVRDPGNTDRQALASSSARRAPVRVAGARKPKAPKAEQVDPARIEATIACMEETIRELTGDSEFSYTRTKRATGDIADLLRGRQVAPSRLKAAMTKMYHTPPDKRTGFDWKEHMTIPAICNNYDRFCIAAVSDGSAQKSKYANPDTPDGSWPDGKYFDDDQTFLQPRQRPGEDIAKYYSRMMIEEADARSAHLYAAQLPTSAPEYAPIQA